MRILQSLAACALAVVAVVTIIFVAMPLSFTGSDAAALAIDASALIAGLVAMVALPLVITRSAGWTALVASVAIPAYLLGVAASSIWVPYWGAWVRCGRQPVIMTSFAADDSYSVPEDRSYGPGLFEEYACTPEQAETAGYHRTPYR